jgi:hypothetical protein
MGLGLVAIGVVGLLSVRGAVYAVEHGGQKPASHEHGGQEHGGTAVTPATHEHGGTTQEHGGEAVQVEPSAEQIRKTIETYVSDVVEEDGAFEIEDEVAGATRTLEFVRVHERVGKTGDLYYSCTDMRDTVSGELLDLDFDVDAGEEGQLEIIDVRIHKVNDQPRYTYDESDNRIPLTSAGGESAPGT